MNSIDWEDFEKLEIRAGTIIKVSDFPEAKKPAYILHIDFGSELGVKKSSAQITLLYEKEELIGKQVIAVVNFFPKQIGSIMSECLVTGFQGSTGGVVLAVPDKAIQNGAKLF